MALGFLKVRGPLFLTKRNFSPLHHDSEVSVAGLGPK